MTTLQLGAAHGAPVQATEAEIDECLRDTVKYPAHHAKMTDLADRAVGDADTPRQKVARLVAFVDDFIEDSYSDESVSVFATLADRKGDCSEHANLFVTLARAAGIPANAPPVVAKLHVKHDADPETVIAVVVCASPR